jgi:hypothetical protein
MTWKGTIVKRRYLAAAAVAAALLLSACGAGMGPVQSMPAGAASVVGDQSVTDATIADIATQVHDQIAALPGSKMPTADVVTNAAVQRETQHLMLQAAGAQEGITITQSQIDEFIASFVKNQFNGDIKQLQAALVSQNYIPLSQVNEAAGDQLMYAAVLKKIAPTATSQDAIAKASNDYFGALSNQLNTRVSPRFGTWSIFGLGPVPDDLSKLPILTENGQPIGGVPAPAPSAS